MVDGVIAGGGWDIGGFIILGGWGGIKLGGNWEFYLKGESYLMKLLGIRYSSTGVVLGWWRRFKWWDIFFIDDFGLIGMDGIRNGFGWFRLRDGNWIPQEVFKEMLIFIKIIKLSWLFEGFEEKFSFLSGVVIFISIDLSEEFEEVRVDITWLGWSFEGFVFWECDFEDAFEWFRGSLWFYNVIKRDTGIFR